MHYAMLVRCGQTRAQLSRNLECFIGRQAANAPQQRREIFAIHVFHGEEYARFRLADTNIGSTPE